MERCIQQARLCKRQKSVWHTGGVSALEKQARTPTLGSFTQHAHLSVTQVQVVNIHSVYYFQWGKPGTSTYGL